jgi:hypothetical protein
MWLDELSEFVIAASSNALPPLAPVPLPPVSLPPVSLPPASVAVAR